MALKRNEPGRPLKNQLFNGLLMRLI